MLKINIPLSVPKNREKEYEKNFRLATNGTGRLMMFAGDQKIEHLNDDFVGRNIPPEVADPEHYFKIASKSHIGIFAAQLGLIAKYGRDYPQIPYLIKANSKTHLLKKEYKDPFGNIWLDFEKIINFKKQSRLNILGVGYTIYIGSWYESKMFNQAANLIYEAHQQGMIAVIWIYPRGKAVKDENDLHLIAGGAGSAVCLGADFVKINYPYGRNGSARANEKFKEAVVAAGRTGVICVGGNKKDPKRFLQTLHNQVHISGTRGAAIGRNIYQRRLNESIRMANAISAVVLYNYTAEDAYKIFLGEMELKETKI
ncbi:MAG: aldolase [Patescibacteria group bacterium]|nr:aldolase [Patescibacteria group bacterium]